MSQHNVFGGDDSEDEDKVRDEAVTGFDSGVVRSKEHKEKQRALVIPSQANVDWREKKKKAQRYRPNEEQPVVESNSTTTREKLNDGPQRIGLQTASNAVKKEVSIDVEDSDVNTAEEIKESVDEQALKSLLSDEKSERKEDQIEAIPMTAPGLSETDAFREDVAARADESTIDEYSRVPIHQFGAALLRGMGWKDGTAASRTRTGPTEPYLPDSRPSLLGIGASARPNNDKDKKGSSNDSRTRKQAMTSYRPLTKQARENSSPKIGRSKRSPSPTGAHSDKKSYYSSSRDYDSDRKSRDRRDHRGDSRRYDDRRDSRRDDRQLDDRRYESRRDSYRDEKRYDDQRYDRKRYESESSRVYEDDRSYRKRY